jgi:hypothetical protein
MVHTAQVIRDGSGAENRDGSEFKPAADNRARRKSLPSLFVGAQSEARNRSYSAWVPMKNQTIVSGAVRKPNARYEAVIRTDHNGSVGCTCLNYRPG